MDKQEGFASVAATAHDQLFLQLPFARVHWPVGGNHNRILLTAVVHARRVVAPIAANGQRHEGHQQLRGRAAKGKFARVYDPASKIGLRENGGTATAPSWGQVGNSNTP
jgi:hypothetical protein